MGVISHRDVMSTTRRFFGLSSHWAKKQVGALVVITRGAMS